MGIGSNLSKLVKVSRKISESSINFLNVVGKQKLKVALISYYYKKPSISGVGIHVQNLAKCMAKHNCTVHVFCNSEEDEFYKEEGVFVHGIGKLLTPVNDSFSKKRLEYDLFESEAVKEMIRENSKKRFDVIHTHGALTKAAFIIRKVYGIPWIHTFHAIEKLRVKELSEEEKQFEDLISWIEHTVNYVDGAIFVSEELLKEGKKHYALKSKRIISNGVDLEMFRYCPITKKNVLFIGRWSKDKGIDILLRIIPGIMSVKGATFTAVCPGQPLDGELKEIRNSVAKLEAEYPERIRIINEPQRQETLREMYRDCQVYIQPSKYESFGLCILEAMATGRPVAAFNVGGIPEVIGNAGFVLENTAAMIYKVKELLGNRSECVQIGKLANKRARIFDWNIIAQKTIKYYEEVIKNE